VDYQTPKGQSIRFLSCEFSFYKGSPNADGEFLFYENRLSNRAEVAAKIARGFLTSVEIALFNAQEEIAAGLKQYDDVGFADWFTNPVYFANKIGIMTGIGGTNNFEPARPITIPESIKANIETISLFSPELNKIKKRVLSDPQYVWPQNYYVILLQYLGEENIPEEFILPGVTAQGINYELLIPSLGNSVTRGSEAHLGGEILDVDPKYQVFN
jgi:hypothetical protein